MATTAEAASIQARKLLVIERLAQLENEELLRIFEQLLKPSEASEWAESMEDLGLGMAMKSVENEPRLSQKEALILLEADEN